MKVNMKMTWENYQRKDRRQLFKECIRRGIKIPANNTCREELILAIHAYDAFHNGMDAGMRRKETERKSIKHIKYNFNLTDYNSEEYHLSLTDDQVALLNWLIKNQMDLSYGNLEKAEPIKYVEI